MVRRSRTIERKLRFETVTMTLHPVRRRPAYTIVELAIVLAILTAFAMLSWPVMMKPWQRSEAQQGAEVVREVLAEARIAAMTEGQVFQFRWQANTNRYEVRSRDPLPIAVQKRDANPLTPPSSVGSTGEASATLTPQRALEMLSRESGEQQLKHKQVVSGQLPADNVFFDARAIETAFFHDDVDEAGIRKAWTPQGNGNPDDELRQRLDRIQAWQSVDFYPDGRCDNQVFTIRSSSDYEVELELRGFTGSVAVSQPRKVRRQTIDLNNLDEIDTSNLAGELVETPDEDEAFQSGAAQ